MKKSYITPKARIIEVETECLIATSPNVGLNTSGSTDNEDDIAVGSYRKKLWED